MADLQNVLVTPNLGLSSSSLTCSTRWLTNSRKPVEQVEFEVFYQDKPEPDVEPITPLLERLVKQFRLRPDQAVKVLEMHSVEVVNRQLYDIHTKKNDGKVKNLGSYTAKVFGLVIEKKKNRPDQ